MKLHNVQSQQDLMTGSKALSVTVAHCLIICGQIFAHAHHGHECQGNLG